ncbi:MAG: adaptor protein MecA [Clostridia bacterium]|nr:adaptor protein MecA [Clostridia bacterium]
MRIEKLSNNKLKVIFSIKELEKENIDYQSFMAGSTNCENILSNLLYIAKNELDFDTKNCSIEIETFEITHGNFMITITKFEDNIKKIKAKRKQGNIKNNSCIYEFSNLNNYHNFIDFLEKKNNNLLVKIKNNSEIIKFCEKYLLIINGSTFSENEVIFFNTTITEFANFKSNSQTLILKLKESLSI